MAPPREETGRERGASRGIGLRIAPRFVVAIMIPLTLVLVVFSYLLLEATGEILGTAVEDARDEAAAGDAAFAKPRHEAFFMEEMHRCDAVEAQVRRRMERGSRKGGRGRWCRERGKERKRERERSRGAEEQRSRGAEERRRSEEKRRRGGEEERRRKRNMSGRAEEEWARREEEESKGSR